MNVLRILAIKRIMSLTVVFLMIGTPLMTMALPYEETRPAISLDLSDLYPSKARGYVDHDDWPMPLHDVTNMGNTTSPMPVDNETIWELDYGTKITTSPAVADNTLYFATHAGMVYAINTSTGEEVWNNDLGAECNSSPAVAGDLVILGTNAGDLVALEMEDGDVNWSKDLGAGINASPIVEDNLTYVVTEDGKVWAHNVSDGAQVWSNDTAAGAIHPPALSSDILLVSSGNSLQAFHASNGTLVWTNTTAGTEISGPMAAGNSSALAGWLAYVTSNDDKLYVFNISEGDLRWTNSISLVEPFIPTKVGSMVLVSGAQEVLAFNHTNNDWMWNYTLSVNLTSSAPIGDGTLMVGAVDGVHVADVDTVSATELWTYDLGGAVNTPALAYGRAFVTTQDGRVVAFAHRPTAIIDNIGPDPVPQGDILTMTGHGTDADAFINYLWTSNIDGRIAEGPNKNTAVISTLSPGEHTIDLMVQDDNWTWSVPALTTVNIDTPTDWPMFRQNSHRTGESDARLPTTSGIKWMVDLTGASENQDIQSSPIIIDDTAFVGTRDFWIHSLNVTTGEEMWSHRTGGSIDSTPAYADGYIYFGSGDSNVYCYDADPLDDGADEGEIDIEHYYDRIWEFNTNGPIWASPVVVDNVVYITTSPAVNIENPNPGRLYAIEAPPGGMPTERWNFVLPNNAPIYSSPLVYEDLVLFGANDNRLYAVNRFTGEEAWNITTGDSIRSSPAAADGLVYVGSNDYRIYAIYSSNGSVAWSKQTEGPISSSPAILDGVVYIGSMDNKLYAYNATSGAEMWTYETGDGIWSSPSAIPGFVVFGSYDGFLYVLNTTSKELEWKRDVVAVAQSSPAIVDETIIIGAAAGYLYAFGKAPDLSVLESSINLSLSTPQVGVKIAISSKITNQGTVTGNGTVKFYDGPTLIHEQFVEIDPDGQVTVEANWTPDDAGNHFLWVNITDIRPHDSDPNNNNALKVVSVLAQTAGWRMFHNNERHTGNLEVPTPNNARLLWSHDLNGAVLASPVIADQLLFIGGDGGAYALIENPPSAQGYVYWKNETITGIEATSAIVNGVVYLASTDGTLYAIDAWNGLTLWAAAVNAGISSPIIVNNSVYIGTSTGEIMALHTDNGTVLWKKSLGGEIRGSPAISGDVVIVGSVNGENSRVNAYDKDSGQEIWSFVTGSDVHSSPSVDDNGNLFISDVNGTIYKMEASPDFKDDGVPNTGKYDLIWSYETAMPIFTTTAVSGNNIYLTAGNNTILSLTSDGERRWERAYSLDENKPLMSSPAVANNKLVVGGDQIYCLDTSTGLEVWSYATTTSVSSSPAITLGKVFFASDGGIMHAFGNITPILPRAIITSPVDNAQFRNDEIINFDASGSTDDGVILEYYWDFGDGIQDYGMNVSHSYDLIGNYTVTLTVKDNEIPPLSDTTAINVEIIPNLKPSIASGAVTPGEGDVSTVFNFTVMYNDPDNDPPSVVTVIVSGVNYPMVPVGTNNDYISGVQYYCATTLPSGNHTYTFRASDGVISVGSSMTGTGPKVWQVGQFVKDEVSVVMEYIGQGLVTIELPTSPPIPPENYTQKDIVRISTEDISEWRWMLLEINGTGRNLDEDVDPDTLTIFWYNLVWTPINTTIEENTYSVNVTSESSSSLGIFGLFGKPLQPNKIPTIKSVSATPKGPYKVGDQVTITVVAEDTENDTLYYRFDWDDGKPIKDWQSENTAKHKFDKGSTYIVRVYVTDVENPDLNTAAAENRTAAREIKIVVREEGSSEALIALAVIIFVVLAIAFAVPTMGAKDDDEEDEKVEEEEEGEEKGDEEEDEEGTLPDDEE